MKRRNSGFTLIELLVVISIIGILSSVVLASLNTAKYKANDAKRRSDLRSLQTALELYYSKNARYPSTGGSWYAVAGPVTAVADWIPGLVADGDISKLPQDPAYPQPTGVAPCFNNWPSMYLYLSSNGTSYKLLAHCSANSNMINAISSDALYDSVRPSWAWQVCSGTDCQS